VIVKFSSLENFIHTPGANAKTELPDFIENNSQGKARQGKFLIVTQSKKQHIHATFYRTIH